MYQSISKKLAPTGVLRIAINTSNFLLVSGKNEQGIPTGISPDLGRKIAEELNLKFKYIEFKKPSEIADSVDQDLWDIGNIAFDPKRAAKIDFTKPYINIDANFLVKKKDNIKTNSQVDELNNKISVFEGSAYDLWLSKNFKNAKIIRATSVDESHDLFYKNEANILAGLRSKLIEDAKKNDDFELIEKPFTFIGQAIATKKGNPDVIKYLNDLILELIKNKYILELLKKYNLEDQLTIPNL